MTISDEDLADAKEISVEQVRLLKASRGATNDTLEGLPTVAVRRALRRLNYPDLPRQRVNFRLEQQRGEDGTVPPHALGVALADTREMRTGAPEIAGMPTGNGHAPGRGPSPTAGMALSNWEWLGPGNIGGRTRAIVVHPGQPDLLWAASAGGGVWHTEDGGVQWAPVDDFLGNLACTCLAMDPSDPSTIYVGTGEGFSNVDAIRGNGVYRTTDGTTWAPVLATQIDDFRFVNRLAVSKSGDVVLAGTGGGLFRCADATLATWTKVLDSAVADVRFDPRDSSRAVAAGIDTGTAWFSRDGGKTWTVASHGPWSGRVELAYAAATAGVVYASVQMTNGEIWRSSDGGKTYVRRQTLDPNGAAAPYLGDQGWYDNTIWAGDPTDADLVVVGGVDLWRSTDGGDTIAEISTWWAPGSVHADHHTIVSHPDYDGIANRTVYFGNDGGVFRSDDITAVGQEPQPPFTQGWTELVNNYGVTQFYGGAGNTTSGKIIGGAQDNGTLCFSDAGGTEGWTQIFGGDGGWCASDPADPDVFYGEYVFLNIHRNTDGGTSDDTQGDRYISGQFWNPAIGEWDWKPVPFRITDAMNANALFIAPFILDPNNTNRILGGGLSLWRTNDAKTPNTMTSGPSWKAVKPSIGSKISALAVTKGDSDRIWVGHVNGAVFRTTNGAAATPTWQRMAATGPNALKPQRYCTCLTATDQNTVYAAFGGYEPDNLWVTTDGGTTWADLSGPLPAAPIRAVAVHPRRANLVYIGAETGVFASEDAGATWGPTNEGPTNCSVDDLFWMGETLVCVTHGRGMFRIDLSGV